MAEEKPLKLFSFLGVNPYTPTTYDWEGQTKTTNFATAACVEFLKPAEVIVFMTEEAKTENFALLQQELESLSIQPVPRIVPLGKDLDELWEIFNELNDAVNDDDVIAMDITNGQRSLPMLALLTTSFMRTARNIDVKYLLYGAYGVNPSSGNGSTAMFDLSEMLDLLDWTVAADRFVRSGDSEDMAILLKNYSKRVKKEGQYSDEAISRGTPFEDASSILRTVTKSLSLLRPYNAMKELFLLNTHLSQITDLGKSEKRISPLYRLLEKIDKSYSEYGNPTPESDEVIEIAKTLEQERNLILWYRDHGHWMQSVSLAREWLVSWVMYRDHKVELLDRCLRKCYEERINDFTHSESEWRSTRFIGSFINGRIFHNLWSEVTNIRNDIAHAGKNDQPNDADALIRRINRQLEIIKGLTI